MLLISNERSMFLSPRKLMLIAGVLLFLASALTSIIGNKYPLLILNENQILYLYSTSAQVLAGIYGLTLTGFIFFRNELSREEFEDNTLTDAVESLKNRYFKILIFITCISVITLFLSNLVISLENNSKSIFTIITMNVGQSFFIVTLIVISYFIYDVIAPRRIEKESKFIQHQIDPSFDENQQGSLEDFLINYNSIESILQKYGRVYQSKNESEYRLNKSRRRISNVRLAEFILQSEKISRNLFEDIRNLITLRNTIIHGAEPVVSEKMVTLSKNILEELSESLKIG